METNPLMENNPKTPKNEIEHDPLNIPTSQEIQPQISHTSVKISEEDENNEDNHSVTSSQNSKCSYFEKICEVVLILLFVPLIYTCQLCIVAILVALFLGLIFSFSIIAATAALPLLVVSFIVTRLLQFFRHGDAYDKAIQLKLFIRTWILLDMAVFIIVLWSFFSVFKYTSGLQHVMLLGLRVSDWVRLYNVIFGIYVLSCIVSVITINFLPLVPLDHTESGLNVPESVLEIIDCLIFWLAEYEVTKRVHVFKHHKLLGLYTRKWIEVSIYVLIAYNFITLSTHFIVWLLRTLVCNQLLEPGTNSKSRRYLIVENFLNRRCLVYWANGMKRSINFILSSLLLLFTWMCYFGSHLDRSARAKKVLEFGTWTCVSLLIYAFLWLIKTYVLLSWEARCVYNRLSSKILEGGKKLYFLGIIGRHQYDILNLLYERKRDEPSYSCHETDESNFKVLIRELCNTLFPTRVMTLHAHYLSKLDDEDDCGHNEESDHVKILLRKKKKRVEHDLLMLEGGTSTLYCIQQSAGYFLTAKKILLKEKYIGDILENLKSCNQDDDDGTIEEKLRRLIQIGNATKNETQEDVSEGAVVDSQHDDWAYFENQMHEYAGSTQEISLENLQTWMEKARDNCLFLANTLSSAKEVVDCLNKIISLLLIVATFIMWLLITGLATTKVLVLIASPLLAATFIFGDACKNLFQGIMFAYVIHPFDVGDLCVIDGTMMEVMTIGVWKTTFSKVGMQEEVIYPNSELSNKNIINYKTDFHWNDYIELDVACLGDKKTKILKYEIEKLLDEDIENFTPSYNSVEVLTTGENMMKMAVNFRHNVNLKNSTYFECLKEKRKRRSEFLLNIQGLVDEKKNGGIQISEI